MINWNKQFTALVRETRPTCWGNWGLNGHIQAGAVGIVDPKTGDFKLVCDQLPGVELIEVVNSQTWEMRTSKVKKTEMKPEASLSFKDPRTGIELKADSKIQWTFGSSGSMASEFAVVKEVRINNLTTLNKQFKWLAEQAGHVGLGNKGRISQSFGVITSVIYATSGMNVGSKDKSSSFSMTGNAKALNTLLGSMAPEASISGSFTNSSEENSLDKHIWPAQANTASSAPIPIAYTFSSFEGDLIIPNWVNTLGSFELEVNSKIGSTYTSKVALRYDTPSGPKEEKGLVVGGQSQTFAAIPLTATNIVLEVKFVDLTDGTYYSKKWDTPLGQWISGKRRIELSGVWPFKTGLKVAEEDN
ncbi:hypothetical protein NVV94_00030 [Pseudomonas sp. LS1212]|uniref:hypothetical protein n=1 Tax=Pseudomonas sp. LS1212 TaxID=2972478 RepID=UPI00215D1EAF|nr:hypothetical protein [Pseudomonas sp. LS1212]UVJ44055.1 hypothetical protein NVV94_00030 [Pseudomonas sp. LS1212]